MSKIKVKSLKKLFPLRPSLFGAPKREVHAVDGISFEIKRGEIFGLVGESGCGKTTCGKLIVRLIPATQGRILIDNEDIGSISRKGLKNFRRKVQMVFQDPYESLNPRFKVSETISEPLEIQRIGGSSERRERLFEVLSEVELTPPEDFLNRFPHELSGGQRQRVSLARALALHPEFIVADEPVSMLDASIRAGIMNLMLKLKERLNLTYLFITHDLAVARYMCDRLAVMYLGKIVELGPTEEVVREALHPYTKALISAVPIPEPEVTRERMELKGELPDPTNPPSGCRFHTRCPKVMNHCKEIEPEMKFLELNHGAACHLL